MSLCKYKDIFGKPNEDAHSHRIPIINLATVDVILTIAASYGISKYYNTSFFIMTIILFIIGIVSHEVFCVDTQLNKYIFNKSL
jgi:hypothetical protein